MIEWEGGHDSRRGFRVASLYGEHREPTHEMLSGVDLLVIDLPDVGSRYYTFIWTTALCLKACHRLGIDVLVLDRPNPIGGLQVEGPVLAPGFESFVGLYPLPTRHGMTLGEIALYLASSFFSGLSVDVQPVEAWSRSDYAEEAEAAWVMPSPNMPTIDTAVVYPGACLLEGTNLSEGRGTTRPFETFGAPFIDGWKLAKSLNEIRLPGVVFRPIQFEPTFQKHLGRLCEGCFVHVTDRRAFEPVLGYVAVLEEVRRQAADDFRWNDPPYEYETVKLPIDILAGNDWLRPAIDAGTHLNEIRERFLHESHEFELLRREAMLYPAGN
jgi:uncharacterized protein YbbC (DUF1343 family)